MPKNLNTHISMILDASGSMASMQTAVVEGFNKFVEEQKNLPGEVTMDLIYFDHEYMPQFHGKDLREVENLTTFPVRGTTSLLDAIGRTVDDLGASLAARNENERPDKVVVVIFTDGGENSSKDYTLKGTKEKIIHQQDVYSWEFIFLGAGIDAVDTASVLGIRAANVANFSQSHVGYASSYAALSGSIGSLRSGQGLESWSGKNLDEDQG